MNITLTDQTLQNEVTRLIQQILQRQPNVNAGQVDRTNLYSLILEEPSTDFTGSVFRLIETFRRGATGQNNISFFNNAIGNSLDAAIDESFRAANNSASLNTLLPAINANAIALTEIDYSDAPENYYCQLSKEIMSDPVHDARHPDIKFERSWILTALKSKQENPFTRTPLTPDELVSDMTLKEEIDHFVEEKIAAFKSPSNSFS